MGESEESSIKNLADNMLSDSTLGLSEALSSAVPGQDGLLSDTLQKAREKKQREQQKKMQARMHQQLGQAREVVDTLQAHPDIHVTYDEADQILYVRLHHDKIIEVGITRQELVMGKVTAEKIKDMLRSRRNQSRKDEEVGYKPYAEQGVKDSFKSPDERKQEELDEVIDKAEEEQEDPFMTEEEQEKSLRAIERGLDEIDSDE